MNDEHRVSDSDREAAVVRLQEASTAGRLTLEELSDRTGLAYGARTHGELVLVTADLPAVDLPAVAAQQPVGRGKRTGWLLGLFVPVVRRGRRPVAARTIVLSLFAPCLLDFRAASFPHEEATLFVFSVFGPVKITVPEQVDVDLSVLSVFAPAIERGSPGPLGAGSPGPLGAGVPRLRVRGASIFGPLLVQHRRS